jgi:hypothetical protein
MAQVVGRRYSALFDFEKEADASNAATLIKKVPARGKKQSHAFGARTVG